MTNPPTPKRRWCQYSLRSLFVLMTIVALISAWAEDYLRRQWALEEFADNLYRRGLSVSYYGELVAVSTSSYPPRVNDASLELLKGSKLVGAVDLHGCVKVTDSGLASLGSCTNLEKMYLTDMRFTDAGLAHLKDLAKLETLFLVGTPISDAGLPHLKSLTHLSTLDIRFTQVTDEAVKKLQEALPNCRIEHRHRMSMIVP